MQEISQFFKQYKEELPYWLKNYKEGMDVAFDTVMGGRVGYYPGSGFDGNLVAVANKAHCVHSFLYVDYLVKKEELENMMDMGSFRGYHSIGRIRMVRTGHYAEWLDSNHCKLHTKNESDAFC